MHSRSLSRALSGAGLLLGLFVFCACKAQTPSPPIPVQKQQEKSMKSEDARVWMQIGERRFALSLTDSRAARAFAAQLPLSLAMSELNGNEKYAALPKALPASASAPGTIRKGDLMLYGADTLVIFYATFSSSYSYSRIGRVDEVEGLALALGRRDVRVVFSKD